MAEKPVFSIVTVTLNALPGLQKTGNSLNIQSFRDFEWIIVDGGSSDGTKDYLTHLNADSCSEPDGGIYDAMNKGLARALGEYVIFLNAGDRLATAATLNRLAHFIDAQKTAPDFIYGDSFENDAYKPARDADQVKLGMFTHHQSMIYRREALQGLAYDTRYKIAADYDFTARVLKTANGAVHFPFPVCIFESGGVSQKKAGIGRREQFTVRGRLKMVGALENISIYLLQAAAWTARGVAPRLYWRVKSSGNKKPGLAQT